MKRRGLWLSVTETAGFVLVAAGAWLVNPAAGLITAGVALVVLANGHGKDTTKP